jgi:hypothetical protein
MTPTFITRKGYRYQDTIGAQVTSILEKKLKRSRLLEREFRSQAKQDPFNGITQRNWIRSRKSRSLYSQLIKHLRSHPEDSDKVLKSLSEKTFRKQLRSLSLSGIDVVVFAPGEGIYQAPDSMERQPNSPSYPILNEVRNGK